MLLHAFKLHIKEITDFLDDVVIKFDPFVDILNAKPEYFGTIDEYDPTTFPYYRVLAGDASMATTPIYGYLPDTNSDILFTKNNLELYPNMKAFYLVADNFKALLNRYPNDKFLIKRIHNPVKDINIAIASDNLSLLETEYTDTYLNDYERYDLIFFLRDFLVKFDYRWYINVFEYEDLYPLAYWSMLWYILPYVLLVKRVLNARTDKVHPYHIWEYLVSVGFGTYRGYLSREQEMFLYRNNEYLKYNVGKKFLLKILSDVFLKPIKYTLSEKTIVCHTEGRDNTSDRVPDILSYDDNDVDYSSNIDFDSFLTDIYKNKADTRDDSQYHQDVTDIFTKSSSNMLFTKFIELVRNSNTAEMLLLLKFILDSVVYLTHKNRLFYEVSVPSPLSNITLDLPNVKEALNLLYYCIYARLGQPPINTFTNFTLTAALSVDSPPSIIDSVNYGACLFDTNMYIDAQDIVDNAPYITANIYSATDLSTKLGSQYSWLFSLINNLQITHDSAIYELFYSTYRTLVPEMKVIQISQSYATYSDYFDAFPVAKELIDSMTTPDEFSELMYNIFEVICPLAYGFTSLARDDENATVMIHKVKEVFNYLTSYNVMFTTPTVDRYDYYELPRIVAHIFPIGNEIVLGVDNLGGVTIHSHEWGRNNYDYEIGMNINTSQTIDLDDIPDIICEAGETSININILSEEFESQELLKSITNEHTIFITDCGTSISLEIQII